MEGRVDRGNLSENRLMNLAAISLCGVKLSSKALVNVR